VKTIFDKLNALQQGLKGYWSERILTEFECALKVSEGKDGKHNDTISKAVDLLTDFYTENGSVTKAAALAAEEILAPVSKDAKSYTIHCVAHAHIDMNWMWGFAETTAITVDTFRTMLNLMNEYPGFKFSQSQASTYRIIEEYDPEMMDEIKKRVKEGRWEVAASTWVEADKNMPNGESFARHVLYTKRYFKEIFNIDPDDLSLDFEPDTFGHNWSIPEIMSKSGVKYYYHHRAYDGHYVYRWQARNNTEVLVFRDPKGYNDVVVNERLPFSVQFCNDVGIRDMLYLYGVGDHGGGPSRRDIECLIDMMTWPVAPHLKFSTYGEFYTNLEKIRDSLPIVNQELNFVFTGCYTTQTRIKMANRTSEDRLYDAETIAAFASTFTGGRDYKESFFKAWEKTLFNQFHDILPGSGTIETREYALGEFQKTMAIVNTNATNSMASIARSIDTSNIAVDEDKLSISEGGGVGYGVDNSSNYRFPQTERGRGRTRIVHLFNTIEFDKIGPVEVIIWDWLYDVSKMSIFDVDGNKVNFEVMDHGVNVGYWGHQQIVVLLDANVPAFGYTTYVITEESSLQSKRYKYLTNTADKYTDSDKIMENNHIKAVFKSGDMRLISLVDKETGRDMVSEYLPACGFRYIHEDTIPGMSAWRVGRYAKITELNEDGKVIIYEQRKGELRQTIRYRMDFERSSLDVAVILDKYSKMLKFDVKIDWHEIGDIKYVPQLNFAVPFNFEASSYRYDIPFGTIDRSPRNDDTPGNSFVMVVPADGDSIKPMMLVTDTRYGYRGVDNSLSVNLVRSATGPDPYPEYGIHYVKIGVGFVDSLCNKDVFKLSSGFVHPLNFVSGTSHVGFLPKEAQFFTLKGDVKCSSVKTAEDTSALIIRVYDINGRGSEIYMDFLKKIKSAKLTDLTEMKDLSTVDIKGTSLKFYLGAYEIATVEVNFI